MTNIRKVVLADNQMYHTFNRAIDRQTIFTTKWEFKRALETLKYYRFANLPFKFSQLLNLPEDERQKIVSELNQKNEKIVEFIAFCFMPNHFHFLVKQLKPNGISKFMSDFTNSYTRYFNTKHERKGHLFEGLFKAVLVENDEQLLHLSRYIHLNPVASFIIKQEELEGYTWSSLPEYLKLNNENLCDKELVMSMLPSLEGYKKFVKAYDKRPIAFDVYRRSCDRFSNNDRTIDSCTILESLFVPLGERTKKSFILIGLNILGFGTNEVKAIDDLIEYRNAIIHADRNKQIKLISKGKYTYLWFENTFKLLRRILYRYVENPWN